MAKNAGTLENNGALTSDESAVETHIKNLPFFARQMLKLLENARYGSLKATMPNGQNFQTRGKESGTQAEITLKN